MVMTLMLAGCGRVDQDMKDLEGHNIDEAVKCLGSPASERSAAGRKLYTWSRATAGWVCTLDIAVDAKGVIMSARAEGNEASCDTFARSWCY